MLPRKVVHMGIALQAKASVSSKDKDRPSIQDRLARIDLLCPGSLCAEGSKGPSGQTAVCAVGKKSAIQVSCEVDMCFCKN